MSGCGDIPVIPSYIGGRRIGSRLGWVEKFAIPHLNGRKIGMAV
jgi:hypothetical protein